MAYAQGSTGQEIVGRGAELQEVSTCLQEACAGTAVTLVVSGDPGVGKTSLIKQSCASAAPGVWVLTGACLPLSSVTVPFLPLRSAIRTAAPLDGIAHPDFDSPVAAPHEVLVAVDDWLTKCSRVQPVVLVVEDLHWADQGTLDLLMYLIAGPSDRRLSIIATLRNGEVVEGHPLDRWLADVRRMPHISWMNLGPLDYQSSGLQVAQVLGAPAHQSLLREVYSLAHGNPYLIRLLVGGLHPESRHLPPQLPTDLRSAVLRSWHRLSAQGRELTELMAVGGHPITARDLDDLASHGGSQLEAEVVLREAASAGIVESDPEGTMWWFHHPLIAEVLEQGMGGPKRRRWHEVFADHAEARMSGGNGVSFEYMAALAHHYDAAGHLAEAYDWTMRAAAATDGAANAGEAAELLQRALELHAILGRGALEREVLLDRLRTAALTAGSMEVELEAVEALLSQIDAGARPLEVSQLMVRESQLRFSTGREFLSVTKMRVAVECARANEQSWQYALALAELANAELWQDEPEGESHASAALEIARHAGNPQALSYAFTACAMAAINSGHLAKARRLAGMGIKAATRARDFWSLFAAIVWQANATESSASQAYAELMRSGQGTMASAGAPHVYIAVIVGYEAGAWMGVGQWEECAKALRIALGSDPGVMADTGVRLTAARLAIWQGRQGEADAHLARAEELAAQTSEYITFEFDAVRAEFHLAAGNPDSAYAVALGDGDPEHMRHIMGEWRLPLAARALADRIQRASDEGRPTADLLPLADDMEARFPVVLHNNFAAELYARQIEAFNLLYRAELGRARATADNGQQWVLAADACRDATLRWEETYSCWRTAEALLLRSHAQRKLATAMLVRGLDLARELRARPLHEALCELAARARIPTDLPITGDPASQFYDVPGLTPKEREILPYVVAGQTYGDIARILVISEKTVSSHISNMLRKTGTATRLDLSRLATRARDDHHH
ncbi:AAA family ATPase [Paeniglutamicibacter sp. ORCA_105]|uniref:helix-turn-helix transcriptional regulator n=1 Tax=Paeniglutamicibacter sp. ORCA_105 TaxID=3377336 RepID=UPI00389356EA